VYSGLRSLVVMAIVNKTPRVEAEILIDGVATREYVDGEDQVEVDTVTRYVEAKSGADFAIRFRSTQKPKHDVSAEALVDGRSVMSTLVLLNDFCNGTLESTVDGVRSSKDGKWSLSKFFFSDLMTSM
jgi:hypothetical protein